MMFDKLNHLAVGQRALITYEVIIDDIHPDGTIQIKRPDGSDDYFPATVIPHIKVEALSTESVALEIGEKVSWVKEVSNFSTKSFEIETGTVIAIHGKVAWISSGKVLQIMESINISRLRRLSGVLIGIPTTETINVGV